MRRIAIAAVAVLIGTGALALAQTTPQPTNPAPHDPAAHNPPAQNPTAHHPIGQHGPSAGREAGMPGMPGMAGGPPPHRAHPHAMMGDRHDHQGPRRPAMMGLVYPAEDRNLSADDVRKIGEAFLLWHGNRSWKVVDVAEAADRTVKFAFATADGSVIARFSMDAKTGRVTRQG